ncbi:MAG: PLxRFG domain-containing protein, partial [Chromatiaceae bacterium]
SIRKRFIHRKGTKGYTADVLRSFAWNMTRQAHQISKLEGMPKLEKLLREIEEGIKTGAADQPDQDTTRQTALLIELKKRHEAIATPDGSALSNMLSALGFVFYLGVSPAAALVNLSQVPIVALPELAARYGSWGAAAKGLTTALVDVARGFSPAVLKGFVTGRPLPSDAANLNDEERAAFVAWSESGVRDRSQAHNLAGIAEADSLLNGPTLNRVMGVVSSLFHAAEVLNRDATLLAAFRLARAKGIDPQTATMQAEEATWNSHFDYGSQNRARIMQGNVAKTVLMFKNYAQHVLYFMGRNLFLWAKGESKEVRQEARTKFTGMMGMTALFAGVAGLPIGGVFVMANALQALFGDDDEPWDAEIEFRNWLAATFPDPVAGMIDRGAVTRLSGLDFASRVSIRDLLWRAPDRDLDGKGLYQHVVEQLLGPIGGLAARPFTMADEVAEGNWARAAEAVVPKFARDLMQAGRFGVEGVTTRNGYPVMTAAELSSYELFWKAMGMQPEALAVRWDANSATKLYEGRIVNRRKALITAAALAMIHKDAATLKLAREEIAGFNKANPEVKIGLATLTRSVRGRNTQRERAQFGVLVNPKLAGLRQTAGGFGYPERAEEEEDPEEEENREE